MLEIPSILLLYNIHKKGVEHIKVEQLHQFDLHKLGILIITGYDECLMMVISFVTFSWIQLTGGAQTRSWHIYF